MSLGRYCRAWGLGDPRLMVRTATSEIFDVRWQGRRAVLKLLTPVGRRAEAAAAGALAAWRGAGSVRVFRSDAGALLLEACETTLADDVLDDREAARLLAGVAARLVASEAARPDDVPQLASRVAHLANADLPEELRALAEGAASRLLASAPAPVLLHGDLHHANVMAVTRGDLHHWVAIDPQPVWGDPAYMVSNIFGNPDGRDDVVRRPGRPEELAEICGDVMGLDPGRIHDWGFVHQCLSAVWAAEDGQDPTARLALARAMAGSVQAA